MKYNYLSKKLDQADENEVFELTGCLSTCDKYEYMIQPENTLQKVSTRDARFYNATSHELRLRFYFVSGRHEVKEQVISHTL